MYSHKKNEMMFFLTFVLTTNHCNIKLEQYASDNAMQKARTPFPLSKKNQVSGWLGARVRVRVDIASCTNYKVERERCNFHWQVSQLILSDGSHI